MGLTCSLRGPKIKPKLTHPSTPPPRSYMKSYVCMYVYTIVSEETKNLYFPWTCVCARCVATSLRMAHSEAHSFSPGTTLEVLKSERFSQLLNESEESVHRLIAEIARKFYKLGLEDGLQAAILSGMKIVSPPQELIRLMTQGYCVTGRRRNCGRATSPARYNKI